MATRKTRKTKENPVLLSRYMRAVSWCCVDEVYVGSLPELDGPSCHGATPEEVYARLDEMVESYKESDTPPGGMERYLREFPAALYRWEWCFEVRKKWRDPLPSISPHSPIAWLHTIASRYVRITWWSEEEGCYIGALPELAVDVFYRAASLKECLEKMQAYAFDVVENVIFFREMIPAPLCCPLAAFPRQ